MKLGSKSKDVDSFVDKLRSEGTGEDSKQLTTALQNGGWVPVISRSFHYWQPAPRWRLLPWLANPGKPAVSPHAEGRAGTRHTV